MNSIVIITGASGGIGSALCRNFLKKGCMTIAVSRNPPDFASLGAYFPIKADISDMNIGEKLAREIGGIAKSEQRILIHNAGMLINKPFETLSSWELEQMNVVNFLAPFRITQALIPWLREAACAHTIYIGSMAGFQGSRKYPGLAGYSVLKAAGSGLMESLAAEYPESRMHFNTLALGAVRTGMLEEAFQGQTGVDVGEMADYIVDFALKGWRFYNGKVLPVSVGDPI